MKIGVQIMDLGLSINTASLPTVRLTMYGNNSIEISSSIVQTCKSKIL